MVGLREHLFCGVLNPKPERTSKAQAQAFVKLLTKRRDEQSVNKKLKKIKNFFQKSIDK